MNSVYTYAGKFLTATTVLLYSNLCWHKLIRIAVRFEASDSSQVLVGLFGFAPEGLTPDLELPYLFRPGFNALPSCVERGSRISFLSIISIIISW